VERVSPEERTGPDSRTNICRTSDVTVDSPHASGITDHLGGARGDNHIGSVQKYVLADL
jgi:hypothetical protein